MTEAMFDRALGAYVGFAIGDALGTSEETVKNSLFRATRKLRNQLGELR